MSETHKQLLQAANSAISKYGNRCCVGRSEKEQI
jgi:hypothetical protein